MVVSRGAARDREDISRSGESPPDAGAVIRRLMREHRLTTAELALAARISERSLTRLRAQGRSSRPRRLTLQRLADAFFDLAHLDADEVYRELMQASDQSSELRQTTLGVRGAAELARLYQSMNPTGRHILLEQARILARELPSQSEQE